VYVSIGSERGQVDVVGAGGDGREIAGATPARGLLRGRAKMSLKGIGSCKRVY